jgi:hypothetical protein
MVKKRAENRAEGVTVCREEVAGLLKPRGMQAQARLELHEI